MNYKLDTDERVFFYEQEFYVLSNFSAFRVQFRGPRSDGAFTSVDYQTAEHAYQAQKFLDHYEIYQAIRDARSAHDAARIAHIYAQMLTPDWDERRVGVMRAIIRQKHQEHEYVRRKLRETGSRKLVEDSWRDSFWGIGPDGAGENMLGKLWMGLRSEYQP